MYSILLDVIRHTHWKSIIGITSSIVEKVELDLGPEKWLEWTQIVDKKGDISREEM